MGLSMHSKRADKQRSYAGFVDSSSRTQPYTASTQPLITVVNLRCAVAEGTSCVETPPCGSFLRPFCPFRMASTPWCHGSLSQRGDRDNRSGNSGNGSSNSTNSNGCGAGNTKGRTPLTGTRAPVSLPIRSASERRAALLRSGVIRNGSSTSPPVLSTVRPPAAAVPAAKHALGDPSSEASERRSPQAVPLPSSNAAAAGAGGITESQPRPSAQQRQRSPITPPTPALQSSSSSAGGDRTTCLAASRTERVLCGSRKSPIDIEKAAATTALAASSAAVPLQLLAPLGAVAGPPFPSPPTAFLVCRCRNEKSYQKRTAAVAEVSRTAAAAAAEEAACIASGLGNVRQQLHVKAQKLWRGGETHQHGVMPLKETKTSTAAPVGTAVAETIGDAHRAEEPVLDTGDATTMILRREKYTDVQQPAGAYATTRADLNSRARCLPPQEGSRCSADADEVAAADALSAALWRTVTRNDNVKRSESSRKEPGGSLQNSTEMLVGGRKTEKRLEHRDARFISGCLRAALTAVCATTALQVSTSDNSDCQREREFTIASTNAAEKLCSHSGTDTVASGEFCLPCAAKRYHPELPSLTPHPFAAASFVLPRHTGQLLPLQAGRRTPHRFTPDCCEGGAEEPSDTLACDGTSSSNWFHTKGRSRGLNTTETGASSCCWRGGTRLRREGGDCCCSKTDQDWTCHAVYIHLGLLYTAADVVASATAAAAGKQPRDARTAAAAAARATHTVGGCPINREALGTVLLRRALLSSVTAPLRATQLLLQREQETLQQAERDHSAFNASRSRRLQMRNSPEQEERALFSPAAETVNSPLKSQGKPSRSGASEPADTRCTSVGAGRGGQLYPSSTHPDVLQRQEEERTSEEEQRGDAGSLENEDTDYVTVCCLDGIDQLQLSQWHQAAGVVSCVLSDIAKTAAVSTAQARAAQETKQKTAVGGEDVCLPSSGAPAAAAPAREVGGAGGATLVQSEGKGAGDTEAAGLCATTNLVATALGCAAASAATAQGRTTLRYVHRVVVLLLWRRSELTVDECAEGEISTGPAKTSQKSLWEAVNGWQQQARGLCPSARLLLLSDDEQLETDAYSYMLQYITEGRSQERNKRSSAGTVRQRQLRDLQRTKQQPAEGLFEQQQQRKEDSAGRVHQQAQWRSRSSCSSLQLDEQWQRQRNRQYQSVMGTSEDVDKGGEAVWHHQQLNGDGHGAIEIVQCSTGAAGRKQRTSTLAAIGDARRKHVTEVAAGERRQRPMHEAQGATRPRQGRRGESKKKLRSCMLYLCGRNFMAAPLVSEGHLWRQTRFGFPEPLQHFVRELENRVYIPMLLRSRLGTADVRRAALSQTESAGVRKSGVSAAAQDRSALLQAQCERLLRWEDQLLPPPRVLLHSCDLRSGRRRVCNDLNGLTTQQEYHPTHGAAVPPDGGLSPQQVLQLVGEKYSGEVQTFLLPVAALASTYVGETEEKLRRLLREAAGAAPAVLVLLGLDQLAARRQLHKPPASRQPRAHKAQQRAPRQREQNQFSFEHPGKLIPQHNVEVRKLRQEHQPWEEGPQQAQPQRSNAAAGGATGLEEDTGEPLLALSVVGRGRSFRKQAEQVTQNMHTATRGDHICTGHLASDEGASVAGSRRTTTTLGENSEPLGFSNSSESESAEEDDQSANEELSIDSRTGAGATSALRRRLLAALLVGLDEIEDRRSCRSALLSLDDPCLTTAAGEADDEDAAEANVTRRWLQQQAGLAVVGVCGGPPEWLDEAVVRAGRLDVWLSWPQGSTGKSW